MIEKHWFRQSSAQTDKGDHKMANMICKTRGDATPKGKARVYFTCHPEDFDTCFSKICDDIFNTHDCAIYYTEDMNAVIQPQEEAIALESNNLFVVPVTLKLLITANRAMDEDIPFAVEKHIPILPILMEQGIDEVYARPDKFGSLQYLSPFGGDGTEIAYAHKLKKYLESVLIGDKVAKRVREAFDAYIFLSYRKKDRRYANELMRMIHRNPECRDIAIWYDEFLTPGESFSENISRILSDSKLFALLVTPSVLEETDGKPNFVMGEEYPAACAAGLDILPAEMEATDKEELGAKFKGLPECVSAYDDEQFRARLLAAIEKAAVSTDNDGPEHQFLIGLAYLNGIDVEVDRERGLALITTAAEKGLPEAMEKLYHMYSVGESVAIDYRAALKWAEQIAVYDLRTYGEEHPDTLAALNNLGTAYYDLGGYEEALELMEKTYWISCKIIGEEHPDTLTSLFNFASALCDYGAYEEALEFMEKAYALSCRIQGEDHPNTLTVLNNLATTYFELGDYEKALELNEKAYTLRRGVLGEEHPDTLSSLVNMASAYGHRGEYEKALDLNNAAYEISCKSRGEEHPDTLTILGNVATMYGALGNEGKTLELTEKVYTIRCRVLGEEHPRTMMSLNNLAYPYFKRGDYQKAVSLMEKVYTVSRKVLGEEHPHTLAALKRLKMIRMMLDT